MDTLTERLHLLYEINRRLATLNDARELQEYITRRTREIFEAEGGALLLLDRKRHEFYFPVASQTAASQVTAAQLAEIRFPADRGVAGWVLAHDQAVWVPDVSQDERFYSDVDRQTAATTRSILAAPLRSSTGNIGVIELINPRYRDFGQADLEFLESLASDIAVSYEKAALLERLRSEVGALRQLCRGLGVVLIAGGLVVAAATVFLRMARAVPLSELPATPAVWIGIAGAVIGAVLLRAARRAA